MYKKVKPQFLETKIILISVRKNPLTDMTSMMIKNLL